MKLPYLTFFLLVLAFAPICLSGQLIDEIIIVEGTEKIWTESPARLEKLIIRGTLKIEDINDIDINASRIIIDGGTLEIGTAQSKFQHRCNIVFHTSKNDSPQGIKVINNGSIIMHGSSRGSESHLETNKMDYTDGKSQKELERNIKISSESIETNATIRIDNAQKVELSGIQFNGLGSKTEASMFWSGQSASSNYINRSVFINSVSNDVVLDGTSVALENNIIISKNGSSIICSPFGEGIGNGIEANLIINNAKNSLFALAIYNPYQSITNNYIRTSEEANGVGILNSSDDADKMWSEPEVISVFSGNIIQYEQDCQNAALALKPIGLQVDDFKHLGIWRFRNNYISNFYYGSIISSKNTVISDFYFKNNTIGIVPGVAYVQNSSFSSEDELVKSDSKAIWVTDVFGNSAPKISDITVENYASGVHFEGLIAPLNYFEKISFNNTPPVSFGALDASSVIRDKDGSFFAEKEEKMLHMGMDHSNMNHSKMNHVEDDMHQSMHISPMVDKGFLLFSKESALVSEHSDFLGNYVNIYKSEGNNFGNLIIATGFGLLDPIHEHGGTFKKLDISNSFNSKTISLEAPTDRHEIFIAANTYYEVDLGLEEMNLFDLSFEWEADPESWVIVKVPYKHSRAYGMHSFGPLIAQSMSEKELEKSETTTYFIDEVNEIALVKLYGDNNKGEMVLYSSDVLTEIAIANKRIPLEMRTDFDKKEITLSYDIPKQTFSKIQMLDYYGNVVETLFNGTTTEEKTTVSVDMNKFDVEDKVYLYSLTIANKVHKGPIHAY